ncbi:hypothetical protein [Herbaspirillum rhizosphaerae]|uniref:hypothetical protein n=1 Tax=Herbaspirillum rhizosphaerae TaxID=346179 RepID=UPI000A906681|nr:hypothetical protein [Herbaspirillum rhizosphaerae]
MTRIEIPEQLRSKLGPEMGEGIHWIDVKLHSGRTLKNLMVLDGKEIVFSQFKSGSDCGSSFSSHDILLIRRQSIFPFWWQRLSK